MEYDAPVQKPVGSIGLLSHPHHSPHLAPWLYEAAAAVGVFFTDDKTKKSCTDFESIQPTFPQGWIFAAEDGTLLIVFQVSF